MKPVSGRLGQKIAALCAASLVIAGAWFGSPAPGQADPQKEVPVTKTEVTLSFAPVVKKAAPAVVNVYASRTQTVQRNPLFDDPVFRQFFGDQGAPGGAPRSETTRSLGSGVLVDPSGLVVTNYHVIDQMTDVKVAMSDQSEYHADIVLRDQRNDLAVLRIKRGEPFPSLEMGSSDTVEVGDIALAIGDPFGVGQTVTQGIVSALARASTNAQGSTFYLQTDASINPGNSGGALVDTHARLIGVNSAIFSQSGGSVGIGFAIPVDMVKIVVAAAKAGDKVVHRPWLGASLQAVTYDIAESFGLNRPIGALVTDVNARGPAAAAGLKQGDLIMAIDGRLVESPESFGFRFGTKPIGGAADIAVRRGAKVEHLTMHLQRAPDTPRPDKVTIDGDSPFAGLSAVNLSPAVAEEMSTLGDREGVVVVDVVADTNAAAVAFQKGDMILSINGTAIKTTADLREATRSRHYYWKLSILRGGQVINTVLNG